MAKTKSKKRYPSKTKKAGNLLKRAFLSTLSWSSLTVFFITAFYLGYLDYTVTRQFAGKRWAVPARVYAGPEELYAGYPKDAGAFIQILEQLRYRKDRYLPAQATYFRRGNQVFLKTRSFKFWEATEPSRELRLTFARTHLREIFDLDNALELPVLRLDPLQIGSFYPTRKEDRILVKLEDVPAAIVYALLAAEDRQFYDHNGVSFRAIIRAAWANLKAGKITQGGSTITQQLVKNFFLTPERTFWRKLNEALMAILLDARFEKDEILEAYINEVYLGQDGSRAIHGFGLASEFYYGRPLQNLRLEDCAMLVGLVRGPSYYDPWRHPTRATQRRNQVIDAVHRQGYVRLDDSVAAKASPLNLAKKPHIVIGRYPAFMELVRKQLRREYQDEDLTSEGLRIFTTLQVDIQEALERTVEELLPRMEKKMAQSQIQAAGLFTRRESGEVVAMVGGYHTNYAGFNRALNAVRPVGSLIKPIVYLTALEDSRRFTLITRLEDKEIRVRTRTGNIWKPKNYDRTQHGLVPLHRALAHSYNLATVRLGLDVGLGRTMKTLRNFGIQREFNLYPSFLLGAGEMSPLEVTQIFQVLASDGFNAPIQTIRAVISMEGDPLQRYPLNVRQVIDPGAAFLVETILQEAVREGTGKLAYSILPKSLKVVGKTGTTNDLRDSWFAGFTGDYLGVVWLGRDDNQPIYLTGASGALRVWAHVMKKISHTPVDLLPPENIEMVWIDPENGLRADAKCDGAVQYPFIRGSAPNEFSSCTRSPAENAASWFKKLFGDD